MKHKRVFKLPIVKQKYNFSCGASVWLTICKYLNIGPKTEHEIMFQLKTKEFKGTHPDQMIKFGNKLGLCIRKHHRMQLKRLKEEIKNGNIVIVCMQNEPGYGHYIIANGFDRYSVYFHDTYHAEPVTRLTNKEFLRKWYDFDHQGKFYCRFAIILCFSD